MNLEIRQTEGLEGLTLRYLDSASNVTKVKQDIDEIKRIMKGNNLYAVAVYFHEMCECLQLLKKFSQDEIVSGIAYREGYIEAHDEAQLKMFRLIVTGLDLGTIAKQKP